MKWQEGGRAHIKGASTSPCVRNCCLDEGDICIGCGRSLDEIRQWTQVDESERQGILDRSRERVRQRRKSFPL